MPDEATMDFFDHLDELRTRLIRSILYLIPGAVLGWALKAYVWDLLSVPFYQAMEGLEWKVQPEMITVGPEQALFVAMQIALATGLVVALVPILFEVWGFVEPALEPHEKRYALLFLPGGVLLFLVGMSFAYLVAPVAFRFMLSFTATLDLAAKIDVSRYLGMLLRMLVAFGMVFELPLVLKLLGKLGLVTASGLLSKWRYAIFIVVVAAAVITPTQDPVNLTILALPLTALYFISVLLVYLDERALRKRERPDRREGTSDDSDEGHHELGLGDDGDSIEQPRPAVGEVEHYGMDAQPAASEGVNADAEAPGAPGEPSAPTRGDDDRGETYLLD